MTDSPTLPPITPDLTGAALPDGVAALQGAAKAWALLRVQGADATRFLHSQLSNDFALVQPGQARLAAFCNAKGRMQASFVAFRVRQDDAGDTWLMLCRSDLLQATLQRLRLFVLRSKVTLDDASAQFDMYGLLGTAAEQAWQGAPPAAAWLHQVQALPHGGERHLVSAYPAREEDGIMPRMWCVQAAGTPAPAGQVLDAATWELAEVRSGVASICKATWEAFVPQMVNYESVGGVHFKKGCYPGQEVVARSQFRGAIKRRACVAAVRLAADAAQPHAGQEIWCIPLGTEAAVEPEPCGLIAQCAPTTQGVELIASLQIAAMDNAARGHCQLRIGDAQGPELTLLPPPYPLREDL